MSTSYPGQTVKPGDELTFSLIFPTATPRAETQRYL